MSFQSAVSPLQQQIEGLRIRSKKIIEQDEGFFFTVPRQSPVTKPIPPARLQYHWWVGPVVRSPHFLHKPQTPFPNQFSPNIYPLNIICLQKKVLESECKRRGPSSVPTDETSWRTPPGAGDVDEGEGLCAASGVRNPPLRDENAGISSPMLWVTYHSSFVLACSNYASAPENLDVIFFTFDSVLSCYPHRDDVGSNPFAFVT